MLDAYALLILLESDKLVDAKLFIAVSASMSEFIAVRDAKWNQATS